MAVESLGVSSHGASRKNLQEMSQARAAKWQNTLQVRNKSVVNLTIFN